jgi:hypothetical protein
MIVVPCIMGNYSILCPSLEACRWCPFRDCGVCLWMVRTLLLFGPYRSHFLSRKSLIAAKNETKEKGWKEEKETLK